MSRRRFRTCWWGACTLLAAACTTTDRTPPGVPLAWEAPAAPVRPADCRAVKPGEPLARVLATAAPGDAFCLETGVHPGPAVVPSGVTLWGPRAAVIRSWPM